MELVRSQPEQRHSSGALLSKDGAEKIDRDVSLDGVFQLSGH